MAEALTLEDTCDGCNSYNKAIRCCHLWTDVCAPVPCAHSKYCTAPCEGISPELSVKRIDVYQLTSTEELKEKRSLFNGVNLDDVKACPLYTSVKAR